MERRSTLGGKVRILVLLVTMMFAATLCIIGFKKATDYTHTGTYIVLLISIVLLLGFAIRIQWTIIHSKIMYYDSYEQTTKFRTGQRRKLERLYPWVLFVLGIIALLQNNDASAAIDSFFSLLF